ncbi:SDR family NAD(P)-dependent oxidoreductase [Azospirillum doebereinerae]
MDFSNTTVLVTGGASGIGRAVSLAFARAGARVALTYMTSADEAATVVAEITQAGGTAEAFAVDTTDPDAVEHVVAATEDRLGPLGVLVANTGGLLQRSRVTETPIDLWRRAIDVNLTSTHLCCQAALRRMEPRKSGSIVAMSSLAAFDGGGPGASHYAAAKGAVASYVRALAKETGPLGIRVNAVAPGLIGTRFHDVFSNADGRRATVARTPLGREGVPDDVADAVLFLASPRAGFLTGEIMQINGGLALY